MGLTAYLIVCLTLVFSFIKQLIELVIHFVSSNYVFKILFGLIKVQANKHQRQNLSVTQTFPFYFYLSSSARELELEDRQSRLQQELRERMAVEGKYRNSRVTLDVCIYNAWISIKLLICLFSISV